MGESSSGGTATEGLTSQESDWESDEAPDWESDEALEDVVMDEAVPWQGPTPDLPIFPDKVVKFMGVQFASGNTPEAGGKDQ